MNKIFFMLLSGNFLAQSINAIFLPISTRYYSLEVFNDLAIFIAILMVSSTVAGLRFDIAILKAKNNLQGIAFFYLSIFFASLVSFLFLIFFLVLELIGINISIKYPFLLSISIFLIVLYNSCLNLANIQKKFGLMTKSRVNQAVVSNFTLIIWGGIIGTPLGLFLGYCMMYSAGIISLFPKLERVSIKTLVNEFKNNLEYPKYSVFESLSDTAGYQIPIAMIGSFTQTSLAGLLFMAIKIANIPISIVARGLSNLYIIKLREDKAFSINIALFKVGIISAILFYSLYFIFVKYEVLILGESWLGVSSILMIIMPWMIVQFVTTVFNPIFYIFSLEKVISFIQIIFGIVRVLLIYLTLYLKPAWILYVFSISNLLFYIVWLSAIYLGFNYKVKGDKKCLV